MTNQVTVIKERARESLIAKGMLGEKLCYYEAIQLCYNGYDIWFASANFRNFFIRAKKVNDKLMLFKYMQDGCIFEYSVHNSDLYEDWIVKN